MPDDFPPCHQTLADRELCRLCRILYRSDKGREFIAEAQLTTWFKKHVEWDKEMEAEYPGHGDPIDMSEL